MNIKLIFADPISESYREKLQTFSDKILAQKLTENRAPSIQFPRMNQETFTGIENLQNEYDDRRYVTELN